MNDKPFQPVHLKDKKLFVLDMDGTFYLGDRLITGSLDFLKKVRETGKDYIFFTNKTLSSPGPS
jgi:ribonucleotide monophosphatase NagD (HAD superfamily)